MIKALVFDVGNVIWNFEAPLLSLHHRLSELVKMDFDDYYSRYLQIYRAIETDDYFLDQWLQSLNPQITSAQVQAILDDHFASVDFNLPLLKLIDHLKSQHIPVGLLSNTENFVHPYIHQPLEKYFDFSLLSWREKIRKPNPAIFTRILNHVSCTPSEILFIDDKKENIAAASSLGFSTHLYTDNSSFENYLFTILPNIFNYLNV